MNIFEYLILPYKMIGAPDDLKKVHWIRETIPTETLPSAKDVNPNALWCIPIWNSSVKLKGIKITRGHVRFAVYFKLVGFSGCVQYAFLALTSRGTKWLSRTSIGFIITNFPSVERNYVNIENYTILLTWRNEFMVYRSAARAFL